MSKTTNEIAKAILERRNRMTHIIMPGEITAEIGPDGVAEALQRRWLVPDTDDGYLCANNDLAVVDEMRKIAEMKAEQPTGQVIPCAESHDLLKLHSKRSHALFEVAAPGTGQPAPGLTATAQPGQSAPPAPMAPPPQPAAPPPPRPPGQAGGDAPMVGTQVTVARQGLRANGVIEKLTPDGRFQVGFPPGQTQRPQGDNIYSKEEISLIPATAAPQ